MVTSRGILALGTAGCSVLWLQRLAFSSVAPLIRDDFNLTYSQLGLIPTIAVVVSAVGYAVSGYFADRFGPRRIILPAIVLLWVTTFGTGFAQDYGQLALFQGAQGFSEGLFWVPAAVLILAWFKPRESGKVMGSMEAGLNVGAFLILAVGGTIATLWGWRSTYYVTSLTSLALLVLMFMFFRSPPRLAGKVGIDYKRVISSFYLWLLSATCAVAFIVWFAVWTFLPTYLVDVKGFPLPVAGSLGAFAIASTIPAALVGGSLADRHGGRRVGVILFGVCAVALTGFVIVPDPTLAVLPLFAFGFALTAVIPVITSTVPREFPSEIVGSAQGFLLAVAVALGAVGPVLMGGLADVLSFQLAFITISLLCVVGLVLMVLARYARR
ncbi:MAG: nitrate/nitrite transporter [Candidatus Bathyarchaeia archaeon]